MKGKPGYSTLQNVTWMIQNAWRTRKSVLWLCILTALAEVSVSLVQLFAAPRVLSCIEQTVPMPQLLATLCAFTAALFLALGLRAYLQANTIHGRIDVRCALLGLCMRKYQTMSFPNVLDASTTKLFKKAQDVMNGNNKASEHIWTTLTLLLQNLIGFGLYLLLLSHLNPALLLLVAVTSALGFFAYKRANQWRYRHREEEATFIAQSYYIYQKAESATLAKDIRIFGLQEWLLDLQASIVRLRGLFAARCAAMELLGGIADVLLSVARNGAAYVYLLTMALQGDLPASEFLLYFSAVSGFTAWVTGILNEMTALHRESLDLCTIREFLSLDESFRFEGGKEIPGAQGYELRLEDVSFRYPDAQEDTLSHVNLTIRAGEKLAIVGLNGAGKTTLVRLLCGLYDPTVGRVLLNGQDIRLFDRHKYYKLFSAVFQEYSVLPVSIAENVAQHWEDIDRQRVADCLAYAGLTQKIAELPAGLDTPLGHEVHEDGALFSGGQMQRLLLARALYKDAPILLLDEPTAALDPIAENDIYLRYNEMTAGKTALFISHRLASTRFCDRILFLDGGGIAEEGTHEALMAQKGKYTELFELQSRYYQEGRSL